MLGSPILYLKAMRILMFQLSGFYCRIQGLGISNGLTIVEARNLEHGFRRIRARIPYTLP